MTVETKRVRYLPTINREMREKLTNYQAATALCRLHRRSRGRLEIGSSSNTICVRFQGRRVRHAYVTMQVTFLRRTSVLIYRRGLRQRVASLTLDCNGVFAIKAYTGSSSHGGATSSALANLDHRHWFIMHPWV